MSLFTIEKGKKFYNTIVNEYNVDRLDNKHAELVKNKI